MSAVTAVILQPTFLPWLGWFDLADQADLLIVLDNVSFSKQSWQQRNRIRTASGLSYVTVPVRTAGRLGQLISDTQLADTTFAEKLIRVVSTNYANAPYFANYFPEFCSVLRAAAAPAELNGLNCGLIDWLIAKLHFNIRQVRSSTLSVDGTRGELVAKLCERVGASRYLSPAGAEEYLLADRAAFDRRSIAVDLHVYVHPEYQQCFKPFIPYATVLDLLMNEGDASGDVLRSGRRPARSLGVAPPQSMLLSE